MRKKKGYFSISSVAEMLSVHQQTIRMYEKEGFVTPKRSDGNTRLFSEENIDRLEEVIHLTHELGINLAGVEMVLKLRKQVNKMQNEMNKLFESAHNNLSEEEANHTNAARTSAKRLAEIKGGKLKELPSNSKPEDGFRPPNVCDWELEYEDQ